MQGFNLVLYLFTIGIGVLACDLKQWFPRWKRCRGLCLERKSQKYNISMKGVLGIEIVIQRDSFLDWLERFLFPCCYTG